MAVAVDARGTGQGTLTSTKVTSFNYNGITVGAGANRALIFAVTIGDDVSAAPSGITCTWDSGGSNQAMTLLTSQADPTAGANGNKVYIYGLRNPTSGNKTLAINWTTAVWIGGNAISFTGVDQTSDVTAFPHTNTGTGATNAVSVAVTSAIGNWTIASYVSLDGAGSGQNHNLWFDSATAGLFTNDNITAQDNTGAATVTFTDTLGGGSPGWGAAAVDIAAVSAATATIVEQSLFDPPAKKKIPIDFANLPFGTVPPLSTTFATSSFFDPPKRIKVPERLQEDFGAGFVFKSPLSLLFDPIQLKRPTIDNPPILFQPAAPAAVAIVEQPLFDAVRPRRPTEFVQGPFAQTSPPIGAFYYTQPLFDSIRLKQPVISILDVTPPEPFKFFGERWFEMVQLRKILVENASILFQPPVIAANIVEQPLFDVLRLVRLPERFAELYPQRYWTPQIYQALFDVTAKLRSPFGLDWTATGAIQLNTVRNALVNFFEIVRFKQPLVETPLATYFPFVTPPTPTALAQYRLLVPHFIAGGHYIAGTIVTEGTELPFGWTPTLAVEPLNDSAIQNYWNVGPKAMTDAQPYRDFFPFFQGYARKVFWLPTGIVGQYQLTGAGAPLGPRT